MLRITLADPNEQSRERLRGKLLEVENVWLEAECSRYDFVADVIHQSRPDALVISLDGDADRALLTVEQLSIAHPDMAIIAISGDHQRLLEALKLGAKFFLTNPVDPDDLQRVIGRLRSDDVAADLETLRRDLACEIVATVLDPTAEPLAGASLSRRRAILFGSEGHGLPTDLVATCDRRLTIPMPPTTDSLNVVVAAGIFLHALGANGG